MEDFYNIIQEHHVGHCDAETTNKKVGIIHVADVHVLVMVQIVVGSIYCVYETRGGF